MNYTSASMLLRPLRFVARLFALSALLATAALAADAGTGTVSGSVTSAGTRNALQGATVTIGSQSGLTDSSGAYSISGVPAGSAEVVITYPGFSDARQPVSVTAGGRSTADVTMKSSDLVTMEKFTVESVKEGQALSIQEQRNALNVKNVTAFDEWGVLPTQNVGELVSRLPGITFTTDEDNLINNVSIGGLPSSYTRLNIDGMSATGVGGDGRTATLHSFSGSMYEQVEIIAGQTPDKRADSLGGQLNLKTRSPLAMSENRRTTYTASGRYFPDTNERNFVVGQRPWRPDFSISHTQIFDVVGGHRNLGIVVNASYQEILNPHDWDILLYDNAVTGPAQLRDYTRQSGLNDRFISAFSARADYRWSPATIVSLRFLYNAGSEPFFNYTAVNPFLSSNTTVSTGGTSTGAIVAGYTDKRIEFLPVNNTTLQPGSVAVGAAEMRINPQRYSFTSKNPTGTLSFEHNWGRLKVDHAYRWSNTHWDSGAGRQREDGTIQVRTKGAIGFILDYTNPHSNVFRQTSGPSVYDPASYTPFVITAANTTTQPVPITSTVVNKRDTVTDTNEVSATANAQYTFGTETPITVRTGLDTVNRRVNNRAVYPRRWYGVVGSVLPTSVGLMPITEFERENGGQRLPVYDPAAVSTTLNNPALWYEDVNFTATQQYTSRRIMEEGVDAGYIQANTRLGKFTILGGVRYEMVTTDTFTYFRARSTPIATEPDHFKRAALDYARLSKDGDYNKTFPSLHLGYDITRNLKLRASYSTSYGRAPLASLVAAVTPSDTARTVTLGNPDLRPQMGKNYDVKLEYYSDTGGEFSVRGYRKDITDYIGSSINTHELVPTGPDNGFDGLYGGYEIIQPTNLGNARFKGLEFDMRQRLSFLPGALKGLTIRGNYTVLRTEGNFGGTVGFSTDAVANFIPKAFNFGLQYTYGKFGANFDVNYQGKWPLLNVSATSPQTARYRESWTVMNAGVSYQIHRNTTAFLSASNIAQEGRTEYIYVPDRVRSQWVIPVSLKFGVTGQF